VTLQIEAGQVIALVGKNGSGKTTLAKLLSRLYLPHHGAIRWDGADLADLDAGQLHRRISVIFKDFARYDLTARENIGLGAIEHIDDPDALPLCVSMPGTVPLVLGRVGPPAVTAPPDPPVTVSGRRSFRPAGRRFGFSSAIVYGCLLHPRWASALVGAARPIAAR